MVDGSGDQGRSAVMSIQGGARVPEDCSGAGVDPGRAIGQVELDGAKGMEARKSMEQHLTKVEPKEIGSPVVPLGQWFQLELREGVAMVELTGQ